MYNLTFVTAVIAVCIVTAEIEAKSFVSAIATFCIFVGSVDVVAVDLTAVSSCWCCTVVLVVALVVIDVSLLLVLMLSL